ncbi:hypothetical protein K458DRAFT_307048 [Lentithecium fluviatile CBS 122367]|uniref:RBR-type E3 ubiquitin transferase n=1 Tax=Lentithecium fluviatile CBS 122367 TaxID=1168545 RepID=A0A6G1IX68_9PLEO|nr:hypothetical protein K458DRAFT_307048 [Lentithecium fluviatile CBS 122367]
MIAAPGLPKIENLSLLTPPSSPPQQQHGFATGSKAATSIPRSIPRSLPTPPLDGSNEPTLAVQKECLSSPRNSLVTCTICKETEHPSTFPARHITRTCTHSTRTCKECIQQWVETCIETRGWDRCTCPDCGEAMSYSDVKAFVGERAFGRYDQLATRAALSSLPHFHWCLSPACTSGQIVAPPQSVFTCTSCGHTYCLNHPTMPYHAGVTCDQFDAGTSTSTNEQATAEEQGLRTVQETSKRCSNALCGWWIQKNEGCDHMTCWKCGFEFCWDCGAGFKGIGRRGASGHRRGCQYWG